MTPAPVTSARLAGLSGLRHAFFTREGGVSEGTYASLNGGIGSHDEPARVVENRRRMAETLQVAPAALLSVYQIHSARVALVNAAWASAARPRADAMVTAIPGLALGITTADCGPVLFADPRARIIGAAHAGWNGAFSGVLEATIAVMEELGANRAGIIAAIGPLIRQPSYEVGPEFVVRFTQADTSNAKFFIPASRADHAMFDLAGYIRARLTRAGIVNIDDVGLCTYADERFFSYRRSVHRSEPDYGRNIHAIMLEP